MKKWKPVIGASVWVFKDPLTEHIEEGVAKIVKIHSNKPLNKKYNILDCDVRFYVDIHCGSKADVYRRQIKYQK